jgi:uncharacterized protein (TIGR02466 family)
MELELTELFATQVVRTSLRSTPEIDPARLCQLILALRAQHPEMRDYRQGVTQAHTWHSIAAGRDALLAHVEFRVLQALFGKLVEAYLNLLIEQYSTHAADVAILRCSPTIWATISDHGGFQYAHNHPQGVALAAYSLVYYPSLGDSPDSGNALVLENPVEVSSYLNSRMLGLLGVDYAKPQHVALADGDVVVFPSWLRHSTEPYLGAAPRIAIACNIAIEDVENRLLGAAARRP